jgi:hypothetical protein
MQIRVYVVAWCCVAGRCRCMFVVGRARCGGQLQAETYLLDSVHDGGSGKSGRRSGMMRQRAIRRDLGKVLN